jgi:hypothetical protein
MLVARRTRIAELGWVEGQSIAFDWRSAEGWVERYPAIMSELVHLKVDAIVTPNGPNSEADDQHYPHRAGRFRRTRRGRLATNLSRGLPPTRRPATAPGKQVKTIRKPHVMAVTLACGSAWMRIGHVGAYTPTYYDQLPGVMIARSAAARRESSLLLDQVGVRGYRKRSCDQASLLWSSFLWLPTRMNRRCGRERCLRCESDPLEIDLDQTRLPSNPLGATTHPVSPEVRKAKDTWSRSVVTSRLFAASQAVRAGDV